MEQNSTYVIYTDASFDDFTKIGTYSIIMMKDNKIIKRTAKKCRIQMNSPTECEIFAIYQAINIILSAYIVNNKKQKFKLRSDCQGAVDFFANSKNKLNIFRNDNETYKMIINKYKKLSKKVNKVGGSISVIWIPRKENKVAHKWTHNAFQRLKECNDKKELILMEKDSLFELLSKESKCEIIKFLFAISNEQKIVVKTQREIAETLNIPISAINKDLKELAELNVLAKVKNGKYALLI